MLLNIMQQECPQSGRDETDIRNFVSPREIAYIRDRIDGLLIFIQNRIRNAATMGLPFEDIIYLMDIQDKYAILVREKLRELVQKKRLKKYVDVYFSPDIDVPPTFGSVMS